MCWSVDGKTLTYGSLREHDSDIFSIPADGGAETRLIIGGRHAEALIIPPMAGGFTFIPAARAKWKSGAGAPTVSSSR